MYQVSVQLINWLLWKLHKEDPVSLHVPAASLFLSRFLQLILRTWPSQVLILSEPEQVLFFVQTANHGNLTELEIVWTTAPSLLSCCFTLWTLRTDIHNDKHRRRSAIRGWEEIIGNFHQCCFCAGLHGGVVVSTVSSQQKVPGLEFACFPCVCVVSLRVLLLPPTAQNHTC